MPSASHLLARQVAISGGSSGGISTAAIALIVVFGIVPVVALIWVVSWLFWCYPYNRSCCCTRRKKKQPDPEISPFEGVVSSDEILRGPRANAPERPVTTFRSDSGNTYVASGNRLTKSRADPRLSVQTMNSTYSYPGLITQEPKPFV